MVKVARRFLFICPFIYGLICAIHILGAEIAEAATYYVATTGSDSKSCTAAQNPGTPKQTIKAALGCLGTANGAGAGQTVEVAAGTYAEELRSIPGGTSWNSPFILRAAAGASVWLKPNTQAVRCATFSNTNTKYVIFDGINCDAVNASHDGYKVTSGASGASSFIRIQNAQIKNAKNQGIITGITGNEFINLNIHHNGVDKFTHGIYLTGTNQLIERCNVHENAGYGIHVYNTGGGVHNNIVRGNAVWGNGTSSDYTAGILLSSGSGNTAYNNVVWNNKYGISVALGASNTQVYNNTVYNNTSDTFGTGRCVGIDSKSTNTTVKNNICWQNTKNWINNQGSGTILSNNLTSNPLLVNAVGGNFALQSGSPAIDEGVTVSEILDDFAGVARPQGGAYDIGAYEYSSGQSTGVLGAPNNLVLGN